MVDQYVKMDPPSASRADQVANMAGRRGAASGGTCEAVYSAFLLIIVESNGKKIEVATVNLITTISMMTITMERLSAMAKDIFALLFKAFGFAAVFWLSWIFIFRPISALNSPASFISLEQERQQADTYAHQLQTANEQLATTSMQQQRMNELLSQWEQQAKRYEAVVQKWEQQTGIRK